MSEIKNIVIIGALTGALLARALEKSLPPTHRLVLIEKNEAAFWPVGSLRAAALPDFENKIFAPVAGFFPKDSRHIALGSTEVTSLGKTSVTISKPAESLSGVTEIPFAYAIIATGSSYAYPSRPVAVDVATSKANLKKTQEDIKQAKSILVIGGGPVGIEFAGEVVDQHPSKKVTLATSGPALLSPAWKSSLADKLEWQLEKAGVELITNAKVDLPSDVKTGELLTESVSVKAGEKTVETDFILIGTGAKANGQLLPADAKDQDGRVKVDQQLRVQSETLGDRYFAVGDIVSAEGSGTFINAQNHVPVVAANLGAVLKGGKPAKAFKPMLGVLTVPIGQKAGASQLFGFVVGEWLTPIIKGKHLFLSTFTKTFSYAF
ncbi:FAD/NAD(P)-binding domain-containing protein [Ceraceosorus guamensis]|uniref:FAD/NAD(P)-binding domain-containing protein n=1 Tax=Ceraceosorus guamensis TaxID=1522189 RepID=A0A316W316_9BASI|nr:FAD/NAD(P)-binding domain-containing protein [Ceraceosorus guamensis]PWN44287.1 FAD/NAD(P)-binding domain-containing protein [Ceraceosorus guamensis]